MTFLSILFTATAILSMAPANAQRGSRTGGLGRPTDRDNDFPRPPNGPDGCDREDVFVDLDTICDTTTMIPCETPRGDEGFFVCRNIDFRPRDDEDGLDFSLCVPPEQGLEGDECGCCGGDCPLACDGTTCDIQMRNGTVVEDAGVLVLVTNRRDDTETERCVTPGASLRLVALGIGICV